MPTRAQQLRQQLEAEVRREAVQTTSLTWRRIQERHDQTSEELQSGTETDAWLLTALSDLAEVERQAKAGIRELATLAVRDLNMSSVTVANILGVATSTVLRWLPPEE